MVQHEGSTIQFDVPAVPIVATSRTQGDQQHQQHQQHQQQQQQQGQPSQQHQQHDVCLLVPQRPQTPQCAQLDAILITSAWGLLGLAHLQQALGGELPIHTYCTEPCLHFFQQLSQELIDCSHALGQYQHSQAEPQTSAQHTAAHSPVLDQQALMQQQLQQMLLDKQLDQQQQHPPSMMQPTLSQQQVLVPSVLQPGGHHQRPLYHQPHNQAAPHTATHPLQQVPPFFTGFPAPPPPPAAAGPAVLWHPVPPPRPPSSPPPAAAPSTAAAAAAAGAVGAGGKQPSGPNGKPGQLHGHQNHHEHEVGGHSVVQLFSPQQLQSVLDAVQIVRFGERVQLPGCFGLTAEARPCGSGIGSCMWLLSCGDQRCVRRGQGRGWGKRTLGD